MRMISLLSLSVIILAASLFPFRRTDTTLIAAGWEIVGQAGGPTQAAAWIGDLGVVGIGPRLVVLDLSDPHNPLELGSTTPFPYFVEDITLVDERAYVAVGGAGMRIVDLTDPAHPVEIGAWDSPGYAEGVQVFQSWAFLADSLDGLRVLNISDPANPQEVAQVYSDHVVNDVILVQQPGQIMAYMAAGGEGVLAADVSQPSSPVESGWSDTSGYAYALATSGPRLFVADGWNGIQVMNITDPSHLEKVNALALPGWALDVTVDGSQAYVACGSNGVQVVDLSDLENPALVGSAGGGGLSRGVAASDSVVLVADILNGLQVFEASPPSGIVQAGQFTLAPNGFKVVVDGTYAYVVTNERGLQIVDVSNPTHPRMVGEYIPDGDITAGVQVHGDRAFLGTAGFIGSQKFTLHVLDISDRAHPRRLAAILSGNGPFRDIFLQGNILYAADEAGVALVDVSDPAHPVQTAALWTNAQDEPFQASVGVVVSGTLAFVAHAPLGLKIVDVSDPYHPSVIGVYNGPQDRGCGAVSIEFRTIYCLGNRSEGSPQVVYAVDVSDPSHPVWLGDYPTRGYPTGLSVVDGLAYISDGGGGLMVVDVSQPGAMKLAGSFDTIGAAYWSAVSGERVYVADGTGGLVILSRSPREKDALVDEIQVAPTPPDAFHTPAPRPLPGIQSPPVRYPLEALRLVLDANQVFDGAGDLPRRHFRAGERGQERLVISTADSGPGTLRQALLDASPADVIRFDSVVFPPSAPAVISLLSNLPQVLTDSLTIDASSAGVVLDGAHIPGDSTGLIIFSDNCVVQGLQIIHFTAQAMGIGGSGCHIGGDRRIGTGPLGQGNLFSGSGVGLAIGNQTGGNVIEGNLIGLDVSGTQAMPNSSGIGGIGVGNLIGGPAPGRNNIISGNTWAGVILLGASVFNTIAGNWIGLGLDGKTSIPNTDGIYVDVGAANNRIGGDSPGERNVISGNREHGVIICNPRGNHISIIGNYIGTDIVGEHAVSNNVGLAIYNSGYNRVGGANPGEGNLISGNTGDGINIGAYENSDNLVTGNLIGLDASGTKPLGNGYGATLSVVARHSIIGGASPAEANFIGGNDTGLRVHGAGTEYNFLVGNVFGENRDRTAAVGNRSAGVLLQAYSARTRVQGNLIAHTGEGTGGAGIGLLVENALSNLFLRNAIYQNIGSGIVLRDGGNGMITPPVMTMAGTGRVVGTTCQNCVVEIYSDDGGQGRLYEGSVQAGRSGAFVFHKIGGLVGPNLTATTTDGYGSTSAFSLPLVRVTWIYLPVMFH